MNSELQEIKDAWDAQPRQETTARALADAYVANHTNEFTGYVEMDIDQLMNAIDVVRLAGLSEDVQRIETWLLHRFQPQVIGGVYQPQLRIVGGE